MWRAGDELRRRIPRLLALNCRRREAASENDKDRGDQ